MSETLALSAYGAHIRLADFTAAEVCRRLRETLPLETTISSGREQPSTSYAVTIVPPRMTGERFRYCVTRDGEEVFAVATEEELLTLLSQELDFAVARHSPGMLFVHAGVVAWRGVAIAVPGRSRSGKSTLIAELVRRGAIYYSDEFAVLDERGWVHPYRRPLSLRGDHIAAENLNLARDDTPRDPLPVPLIVAGDYQPLATWTPAVIGGAPAVLPLIDGTIVAREQPARTLAVAARVAATVVTLRGPRPDAGAVALEVLDLIDDALVSAALAAHDGNTIHFASDVKRVAERRFSTATRPPVSDRELVAGRHVRVTDFLAPDAHRQLLEHVLAGEKEVVESGIINQDGKGVLDYGFRRSHTIADARLEEMWSLFEDRLRALLPGVRRQLGLPWFPLGKIERQLVLHGDGGFFAPHVDTGDPAVAKRRASCVYYFHRTPRRYSGGELRLYDTWVTPTGSTPAGTYTALAPIDNSMVFFPSSAFHEVCPVRSETDAFADGRFAVTIWFWEGEWPAEILTAEAQRRGEDGALGGRTSV